MHDEVRELHSSDGGVLLDIRHGHMFRLNPVGSRIVKLIKSGRSQAQIALEISEEFGVALDTVRKDVSEFLTTLERHHLTEILENIVGGS